MARRILNRKDLRADYDAAERRQQDGEEKDETEEEADDDDSDEVEAEGDAEVEAEVEADAGADAGADASGDVEEKVAPKKKRPAKVAKPKVPKAPKAPKTAKPKSRSRTPKVTRQKVVWGVFNNSNQRVAVYDYPKRQDAFDHATRLTTDKKSTHFVQPVKEPMEEKNDE